MRKKPNEYSANDYRYYLAHHGILGMKWGRKNGPPYPLDASDHSSSEKKAGWRKSLDGSIQKMKEERQAKGEQKIAKQRFDRAMYDESMALTKKSDRVIDDYLNLTEQYDDLYKKATSDPKLTSYLQKKVEKLADDYSYDGSESYQRDLLSDDVDDAIDDWLNKTDEGRSVQKSVKDIDKRCDELRGPELEKSFERVADASGETSNSSKMKNQIMDELWKSMGSNTYQINSIQGELYDFNKDLDSRYDLVNKLVDDFWEKKSSDAFYEEMKNDFTKVAKNSSSPMLNNMSKGQQKQVDKLIKQVTGPTNGLSKGQIKQINKMMEKIAPGSKPFKPITLEDYHEGKDFMRRAEELQKSGNLSKEQQKLVERLIEEAKRPRL